MKRPTERNGLKIVTYIADRSYIYFIISILFYVCICDQYALGYFKCFAQIDIRKQPRGEL